MSDENDGLQKTGITLTQSSAKADAAEVKLPVNLRDWFAGMALLGIVMRDGCGSDGTREGNASEAILQADAMLKARSQ